MSGSNLVSLMFIPFLMAVFVNGQKGVGAVEQPSAREAFASSRTKRQSKHAFFIPVAFTQSSQDLLQSQTQMPAFSRMDCTYLGNALRAAE